MSERKIDIYNHVMPRAVADRIRELAPGKGDMVKRVTSIPMRLNRRVGEGQHLLIGRPLVHHADFTAPRNNTG